MTPERLHEYVFGVTIADDVSARDVQLPQTLRREYLQPGDVVRATIASADRAIDLGERRHVIEGASA